MRNSRYATWLSTVLGLVILVASSVAPAAEPSSGTIDADNQRVEWVGPTPPPPPTAQAGCNGPNDPNCDHFQLNVVEPGFPFQVEIVVDQGGGDWDLSIFDAEGNEVGGSGNAPGVPETVKLSACSTGQFTVSAAPFAPGIPTYSGSAEFIELASCEGGGGDEPPTDLPNVGAFITTAPISVRPDDPDFDDYAPSFGEEGIGGDGAGEPSIGIPHSNNAVLQQTEPTKTRTMYIALLDTLRSTFDQCTSPPQVTWENKNVPWHFTSLDPILETDHESSRTFSSQLAGKTSLLGFSDDEGENWTPSQGAGINSGVDHQTVGVGPFAEADAVGAASPEVYDRAVYYASQDIVAAEAAISRDGGLTFGPAVPMWTLADCSGLHGHIEVSPTNDGTVYVPNGACNGGADSGFGISLDGGTTWETPRIVPGMGPGDDPGMGVATDGTVYFAQCTDGNAFPKVAKSSDKGENWTQPVQLGEAFGIQQCVFPAVAAGDPDRAAVFFLGSSQGPPSAGTSNTGTGSFPGAWRAYVAVTYDGGETWTTFLASPPNDPVQRGQICLGGTGCESNRNLLDFNDIQEDRQGRIYIAYADGCVGACESDPSAATTDDVARIGVSQPGIKGLYAAFDDELAPARAGGPGPTAPRSPYVEARDVGGGAEVRWSIPYDGGEPIAEFRVFRETDVESRTLIATTGPDQQAFLDPTTDPALNPLYEVIAVNAIGASQAPPSCDNRAALAGQGAPAVEDNPCGFPGVRVADDARGDQDQTLGGPEHDIDWVAMHEKAEDTNPEDGVVDQKLFYIMEVANLEGDLPPNTNWRIDWEAPNGVVYFVDMETNELSQVNFTYGWQDGNIFRTVGDADFGTFDPDGTIQIVNSLSKFEAIATGAGPTGMEAGATLTSVSGTTQQLIGAGGTGLLATIDESPQGAYRMIGNQACVNNPPVARDDTAETNENESVLIDVLANDSDPDGDPLSLAGFRTDAENGEAVAVSDEDGELIEYRPDDGFTGEDTFEYTVRDDKGAEDSALVTVTVNPGDGGNGGVAEVECDAEEMTQSGAWQTQTTDDGEKYCRNVGNAGNGASDEQAFLEFDFPGSSTEVRFDYFTNPRGGVVEVIIDGESRAVVDQFRDGSDKSGKKDLESESRTFTVTERSEAHTVRVQHRTDLDGGNRNIAYVDGFAVNQGATGSADSRSQEKEFSGEMAPGESREHTIAADLDTLILGAVVEPVDAALFGTDALTVELYDPLGLRIGISEQALAPEVVLALSVVPGDYTVKVTNASDQPVSYQASTIRTQVLP